MKKLTAALVGAGNRGQIYADYALFSPDELQIIATVDPNELRLAEAKEKYGLADGQLFDNLDAFLKKIFHAISLSMQRWTKCITKQRKSLFWQAIISYWKNRSRLV